MIKSDNVFADLVRIVLEYVPASLILGVVALVIIAYFKAYRSDRFQNVRSGLLPKHVVLIAISYTLLIIDQMLNIHERAGGEFSYHQLFLVPAFITGLWAMAIVLKYERKRYSFNATLAADMDDLDDPHLTVKNQVPDGER